MKALNLSAILLVLNIIFLSSCTELNTVGFNKSDGYKLHLNIVKDEYDLMSRANEAHWQDGDCLFVLCNNGLQKTSGIARYTQSEDLWNIKFDGELPSGNLTCEVFFYDNYKRNGDILTLSSNTCVYCDYNARLSISDNELYLKASLSLPMARLRIKGQVDSQSRIVGLKIPESFDIKSGEIVFSKSPLDIIIREDGYTDYIYGLIENSENAISLIDGGTAYKKSFPENLISAGKSGYFDMPSPDNHIGWEAYTVSKPELSNIKISEVGYRKTSVDASIASNGNGTITEYGYCYSLYSNPSIDNVTLKLATNDGISFSTAIEGLQPNTTYHIRAYAMNEFGVGYSEDAEVTTKTAIAPSLSSVTVSNIESKSLSLETDIEDIGDDYLTACGYVYSNTNQQPTLSDDTFVCENGDNVCGTITGLVFDTTYYIRAYATNPQGTSYSETVSVTTKKDPTVWDGKSVANAFDGGIGSKEDPIRIATAAQLKLLADNVNLKGMKYANVNFTLTTDIDLNNFPWVPIGWESCYFSGIFDGEGHIVKGINTQPYFDTYYQYAGFFGYGYGMTIRNLAISGYIYRNQASDENNVGGIIGNTYSGIIENCINYCNMDMGGGITTILREELEINNCVNYGVGASGGVTGEGIPYYPGKCNNSFWIYDVVNGTGNEFATPSSTPSSAFKDCAPFVPTGNQCKILPNYTKDLVDELNKWVDLNEGEVSYNKWTYEIVNGAARPVLIPTN